MIAGLAALFLLQAGRPDVVFLLADDLGKDALADAVTPELDSFAARSVRFTRWYTQTNCSPSRAMLLTGRQPLPAWDLGTNIGPKAQDPDPLTNPSLPTDALLLPEALATAGYATLAVGKWNLSNFTTVGQLEESARVHGFDAARALSNFGLGGSGYGGGTSGSATHSVIDDGIAKASPVYNTTLIVDRFLAWWSATPSPRFAYVAFHAPHAPFHAPPPGLTPSGPPVGTDREKYLAMVEALDTEIGRLLLGIDPATTVVFFAGDNGTPNAVAPPALAGKVKGSMYDGGVSPPLFVRFPAFPPRDVDALASATDVWATVAELAGYRGERPRDSISLVPALLGRGETQRDLVVAGHRVPNGPGPYTSYRRMAFDGAHKLILDGVGPSPTATLLGPDDAPVPVDAGIVARLSARLAQLGF